ncbi:uncharacterized protein [Littorina saxatilis]|uniref:uncharacterized protein isoform X2 n=1 Tax=Littorina saxatilis TaxID=31220 RepID=UPI0038B5763A
MSAEESEGLVVPQPPRPLTPTAPPPLSPPQQPTTVTSPTSTAAMPVINNLPTIFGEVFDRDVTFCVDTSGSMFQCLHVVKEHLIETLMKHAQREGETTFNIIEFNSEVTQWSDKMVVCTPETVQVAAGWIKDLEAKTGTNTLDALLTALQDRNCQAVYLVTDGLPDTFAEDILDVVIEATQGRPIHCIYLTGDKAEQPAVEFLEDLAVESFGSFHIVSLTTHGCVERIEPIYRQEHANQKVIRTVNNTLRPNFKNCSVATTLQIDPDDILQNTPNTASLGLLGMPPNCPPWWGWRYWGLGQPYRYNFPATWSRYRPAKSWLKAQDKMNDIADSGLSPSAGSLLINKKVLARRIADGYFYMGTVQSQILEDKFLIAFGPCKHGKFRETTYQDTFVFDIVDYCDAQRHTIITGDHVLAPWEPEGERYGPGIVIDGQEKRQAVGPDDHQLTVAFSNGKTEKVGMEKAIWIPQPVYERLSLELKMPIDTRTSIMNTDHYPQTTLPGYPTSGPQPSPPEYYTPDYYTLEPNSHAGWDRWVYPEYLGYYPPYPLVMRKKYNPKEWELTVEDEEDYVIPGTNLTKRELDDRISSQLSEHTGGRLQSADTPIRLLRKRGKLEPENTLKKSVSFNDSNLEQVSFEKSDSRADADSGIASSPELDMDAATQEQWELIEEEKRKIAVEKRRLEDQRRYLEEAEHRSREVDDDPRLKGYRSPGVGRRYLEEAEQRSREVDDDPRLKFYRSPGVGRRPGWQYWSTNPSPDLPKYIFSGGGDSGVRSSSHDGPFRETALQAPLEARDQRHSPYSVEWTSPNFKYVDTFAKHDYSNSVEGCMKTPHPPQPPSGDGGDRNYVVPPPRPPTEDEKADARKEYRRKRCMHRQMAWRDRISHEDHMKALMQDGHRERIEAQIARERERQEKERDMIANAREAKKKVSVELRARIEKNQEREKDREDNRLNALKQRREHREGMEAQRQKEIEETRERREAVRRQNCEKRHDAVTVKLEDQDAKNQALDQQHRNAKMHRLQHFHKLEYESQAKKDLRIGVTEQHLSLCRSQIFP